MATLQELRSQIADLEQQAAEMHERESQAAIATVRELIGKYGLSAGQVGLAPAPSRIASPKAASKKAGKKSARPGAGIPKFADPASGKTWTGFGKPPAWIAGAKDRDAFRIEPSAPAARAKPASKKRTSKGAKAA